LRSAVHDHRLRTNNRNLPPPHKKKEDPIKNSDEKCYEKKSFFPEKGYVTCEIDIMWKNVPKRKVYKIKPSFE
jgi:hypothetical protein